MSQTIHIRADRYEIAIPDYGTHLGMDEIVSLAGRAGSHYFEPGTMRFFRSRLDWHTWAGADGWYFVTSERNHGRGGPYRRRYSVRRFSLTADRTGIAIDTIGAFQQYATLRQARTAARRAALDAVTPHTTTNTDGAS